MMKLKTKYLRAFCLICAAVLMTAALSVSAFAADPTIEEQMAANSAAWWVAHNAGDQATCDALHAANVALAEQAASGGGSSTYNAQSGTWDITTSSGSNISSSSSQDGKQTTSTYTTTTSSGSVASTSTESYSDDSISSYMGNGGTHQGLQTSYNNAAAAVTSSNNYGSTAARNSASGEVAVAKELLGLSDSEASQLQRELEAEKQAYDAAQTAYNNAVRNGDTAAADRARAQMDAAHDAAQDTRARYNYTGDEPSTVDGGYYHGNSGGSSGGNGGGFYVSTGVSSTYKITSSCNEGGTISPNGTTSVRRGRSQSYTITPNTGYRIKSVTVDGSDQGAISSYTFSNVKKAHKITATFEKTTNSITASAGNGGSISPSGTISVSYGGSKTFTITPSTGYKIKSVTVDGVNKGAISSFTFSNVTGTNTISATFEKKSFAISASAGTGGTISPSGSVNVAYGESKVFTITPSTGYKIKNVVVDGANKGAISSFTFSNVTGAHSISATFEKQTFTISASAGTGGTISPSGSVNVTYGESKVFTVTPSTGYKIKNIVVDGVNKGAINSFTFSNVTGAHSISATFEKKTYAITAIAGTGGSISPSGAVTVEHGASKAFSITPAKGYKVSSVTVDGSNKVPSPLIPSAT